MKNSEFKAVVGEAGRVLKALGALAVVAFAGILFVEWPRTDYAPGYSEAAFDALAIGADAAQVRAALGEPLEVRDEWTGGDTQSRFIYSRPSPGWQNYRLRAVVLDSRGRLVEKVAEFFVPFRVDP